MENTTHPTKARVEFQDIPEMNLKRDIRIASRAGRFLFLVCLMLATYGLFAQSRKKQALFLQETSIENFGMKYEKGAVHFTWMAVASIEPGIYLLQKSEDGSNYRTVVNIKSEPSEKKLRFDFIDEKLSKGVFYYRLKKINFDLTLEYSGLLRVVSPIEKDDEFFETYNEVLITKIED